MLVRRHVRFGITQFAARASLTIRRIVDWASGVLARGNLPARLHKTRILTTFLRNDRPSSIVAFVLLGERMSDEDDPTMLEPHTEPSAPPVLLTPAMARAIELARELLRERGLSDEEIEQELQRQARAWPDF